MGRFKKYKTDEERFYGYGASITKSNENIKKKRIEELQSENLPLVKEKLKTIQKNLHIIVTNKKDLTTIMTCIDKLMKKYEARKETEIENDN